MTLNKYIIPIFLVITIILLVACRDNTVRSGSETGLNITSVFPLQGKYGTTVTIQGTEFSSDISGNTVTFNGVMAALTEASATMLKAEVPKGAKSGPVKVTVDGSTTEGPDFSYLPTVTVTTYAGTGTQGFSDGTALEASFRSPVGLELGPDGTLYIVDYGNHSIRVVTPSGQVETLAGNGTRGFANGVGSEARFYRPIDVDLNQQGGVFVSDFGNHMIRFITPSGNVGTFAGSIPGYTDGAPSEARFRFPAGIELADNDTLYVSDSENNRIRWVAPNGQVGTYAGSGNFGLVNGYVTQAQFRWPVGLDTGSRNRLFVADHTNHSIRMISSDGVVSTFSGNGEQGYMEGDRLEARYHSPYDVALDENNVVYVADFENNRIRRITPRGQVMNLAGDGTAGYMDGNESEARFDHPIALAVNSEGTELFVADYFNHVIRKIELE